MKRFLILFISCVIVLNTNAQQGNSLTAKDYQKAESFMSYNTQRFIDRGSIAPNWMTGDKFWYRTLTSDGSEFILVDPSKRSRTVAFDHKKLANSLSSATGTKSLCATDLRISSSIFQAFKKSEQSIFALVGFFVHSVIPSR